MSTPRNQRTYGSITCVLFLVLSSASAQLNLTAESEQSQAAGPSDHQSSVGTITENDLRHHQSRRSKKRCSESCQCQFQLLEQPGYLVASVNGVTKTIPNPQSWLQQHQMTLQLSERFPVANTSSHAQCRPRTTWSLPRPRQSETSL